MEGRGPGWGSVGCLWGYAWPHTAGEEGGRAMAAGGLWGPPAEGAEAETPVSCTPLGEC